MCYQNRTTAKAIDSLLWIAENDKRYIFHLVAKRFCLDEDGRQGQARNKLVLIGRNLDREMLRSQLETCLSPAPTAPCLVATVLD